MRLWSIHPCYLDPIGIVALWRETLLAQKVLEGKTTGYTSHPQLNRFRQSVNPPGSIASYLKTVYIESCKRGYHFDKTKIHDRPSSMKIPITGQQLLFEFNHLKKKLQHRSFDYFVKLQDITVPLPHPLFGVVQGPIEPWEKTIVSSALL